MAANDKYYVKEENLTRVANAIRNKGGTTGKLIFPGGFVTAINNISAGVALTDSSYLFCNGSRIDQYQKWLNLIPKSSGWVKADAMFKDANWFVTPLSLYDYWGDSLQSNNEMFANVGETVETINLPRGFKIAGSEGGQFRDNPFLVTIYDNSGFGLDTSDGTTSIANLFRGCSRLNAIPSDVQNWDVSKITNMSFAFKGLGEYGEGGELYFYNWDVGNVSNFSSMFADCKFSVQGLETWNVGQNVSTLNISTMFQNYQGVNDLDLSGWDISKLTAAPMNVFQGCKAYKIDCSGWRWDGITWGSLGSLFGYCEATQINAEFASTGGVSGVSYSLAANCPNLQTFKIAGNWAKMKLGGSEFWNDTNLANLVIGEDISGNGKPLELTNTGAFTNSGVESGMAIIYVPDDLVETYQNMTNWAKYAGQIRPRSEYYGG